MSIGSNLLGLYGYYKDARTERLQAEQKEALSRIKERREAIDEMIKVRDLQLRDMDISKRKVTDPLDISSLQMDTERKGLENLDLGKKIEAKLTANFYNRDIEADLAQKELVNAKANLENIENKLLLNAKIENDYFDKHIKGEITKAEYSNLTAELDMEAKRLNNQAKEIENKYLPEKLKRQGTLEEKEMELKDIELMREQKQFDIDEEFDIQKRTTIADITEKEKNVALIGISKNKEDALKLKITGDFAVKSDKIYNQLINLYDGFEKDDEIMMHYTTVEQLHENMDPLMNDFIPTELKSMEYGEGLEYRHMMEKELSEYIKRYTDLKPSISDNKEEIKRKTAALANLAQDMKKAQEDAMRDMPDLTKNMRNSDYRKSYESYKKTLTERINDSVNNVVKFSAGVSVGKEFVMKTIQDMSDEDFEKFKENLRASVYAETTIFKNMFNEEDVRSAITGVLGTVSRINANTESDLIMKMVYGADDEIHKVIKQKKRSEQIKKTKSFGDMLDRGLEN